MPLSRFRVEVLAEAPLCREFRDCAPEPFCLIVAAVRPQTVHQQPVHLDPRRAAPVAPRGVFRRFPVVAGRGIPLLLRSKAERGGEQAAQHRLRALLTGDAGEEGGKPGQRGHRYRLFRGEIVVGVVAPVAVPQLPVHGVGGAASARFERRGVFAQKTGQLRHVLFRAAEQRVEQDVLHQKRAAVAEDLPFVVPPLPEEVHKKDIAVVVRVERPFLWSYGASVSSAEAGKMCGRHVHPRQHGIPQGGVILAGLPRVDDVHHTLASRVAFPVEPVVPCAQLREELRREAERLSLSLLSRAADDVEDCRGVVRRLYDAGSAWGKRGERVSFGLPEFRTREVRCVGGRVVEDDMRYAPVRPLRAEERTKFALRSLPVVAGVPGGDERGVPGPLVRVLVLRGNGESVLPVFVEHLASRLQQRGCLL